MTTGKTIALARRTFVGKVMSLLFNTLSGLVITFFPRSKTLLISWLQSLSAVILESPKIKSATVSTFPIYLPWSDRTRCHDLSFLNVGFKLAFSLSSFTLIKRLFSSSSLSALECYHMHVWGCWYFSRQSWFQLVIHPVQSPNHWIINYVADGRQWWNFEGTDNILFIELAPCGSWLCENWAFTLGFVYSPTCNGLIQKVLQVFPQYFTEKPEWPFWPKQYVKLQ